MSDPLNPGQLRRKPVLLAAGVLTCLLLQACSKAAPTRYGAPIEGYNHTSAAINYFSVNGGGGSNFGPHLGGGSQTCCASMPAKWYPGLTAVVEWEKDPSPFDSATWSEPRYSDAWRARMRAQESEYTRHRAIVEVAPYEELGVVSVHFLPCDQIKVAAGRTYRGMPEHPYNYPYKMEVPNPCPMP